MQKAEIAASASTATVATVASIATTNWAVMVFGVPLPVLLAGFAGSVIALSFLPPIVKKSRSFITVAVGTFVAAYGVKIIAKWLGWDAELHPPLAFFIGLLAHITLTWVFTKGPKAADKKWLGDDR